MGMSWMLVQRKVRQEEVSLSAADIGRGCDKVGTWLLEIISRIMKAVSTCWHEIKIKCRLLANVVSAKRRRS